jgi:hypothetical protein
MKTNPALAIVTVAVMLCCAAEASAQLFGRRDLGRPLSRRASSSAQSSSASGQGQSRTAMRGRLTDSLFENVGSVDEAARYIRGNRESGDFVGADSTERRGFVGAQQATEIGAEPEITSSIDELEIEATPDANQTAQPAALPRISMNPPRLQVGFDFRPRLPSDVTAKLARRLESTLSLDESSSIEASVEDGVAILRGEVSSERDRRMAGLLVRFEPGIADVRNELKVTAPAAKADAPLRRTEGR